MKTIKKLTLAAVAATMLFQTSIARADNNGAATFNFTKWVIPSSPPPGVLKDMAGLIVGGGGGGDVGDGQFTGELLSNVSVLPPPPGVSSLRLIEAVYHFHGSKHSFTARVNVVQTRVGTVTTAVFTGVVTDGWLKGHAVEGGYTVIPPCGYGGGAGIGNCFEVTLDIIKRDSDDSDDSED